MQERVFHNRYNMLSTSIKNIIAMFLVEKKESFLLLDIYIYI